MKLKLILAVALLCCFARQTAFSQSGASVTVAVNKYDSLLTLAKQGLATMDAFDTLQKWHAKIWTDYLEVIKENELLRRNDSIYRLNETILVQQKEAQERKANIYEDKYNKEHKKQARAFGIGPEVGYNPFTRQPSFSIGVHWSLIRFSLRGLFDGETKADKYNPTIYSTIGH